MSTRLMRWAARLVGRAREATRRPGPEGAPSRVVMDWLGSSGLAVVEGAELSGGGAVDYFGFGVGGELVLFGSAVDRPGPEVAARLQAAAAQLGSFSSDTLDRLLLEGPPFAEAVARAARRSGRDWDERLFRARLDDTLARRDFKLIVLTPRRGRRGAPLAIVDLTSSPPR